MQGKLLAVLALVAAVALAGCLGAGSGDDAPPTDRGDDEGGSATDPPLAPFDHRIVHDFTEGDATVTIAVPENATVGSIELYFDAWYPPQTVDGPGLCATAETLTIQLGRPGDDTIASNDFDGPATTTGTTDDCGGTGAFGSGPLVPGAWTATFEGTGVALGHVVFAS